PADELLAGLRPRLACRAPLRAPRHLCGLRRARGRPEPLHSDRCVEPCTGRVRARDRGPLRARAPRLRRRRGPTALRAALHLAGRPPHARARRRTPPSAPERSTGARPRRRAAPAVACRTLGRIALMARNTSFYYSFLVLPARQRHAIVAVWDFCRAVDDAVDEAHGGPGGAAAREAIPAWPRALAPRYPARTPTPTPGPGL